MASITKWKEIYEVETSHGAFYTGGNVEWHKNHLYCQMTSSVSVLDTDTGNITLKVGEESSEDADTIQTFTSDGLRVITSHKSGLLKLWNDKGELEKTWKYIHRGPIAKLTLNGEILASGGSDGTVRIWNLQHHACALSLKEAQGVVSVVELEGGLVFASGDDGKIYSWDLEKGRVQTVYNAHFSKVNCVVFHEDCRHFVSCGRDKVLILWELGNAVSLRTVPTYEAIESVAVLPVKFKLPGFKPTAEGGGVYVVGGGESGAVKVWDVTKSRVVFTQNNSLVSKGKEEGGLAIVRVLLDGAKKKLGVVSAEHNVIVHILKSFECLRQFVGFSDEILDVVYFGKNDSHLAVATNSVDIKLYEVATLNCQLLKGHTDIVLSLVTAKSNRNLLASSSKDNSVRLWLLVANKVNCVGVGMRHTGSVGCCAFSNAQLAFLVTGAQDTCLKLWQLPPKFTEKTVLNCAQTQIAHQKDINAIAVAPNDQIIATASQDKTARLWAAQTLAPLGTLRGHKRGVWCVRFSPVDQVVVTSSADCTLKLWSITDLSCLKTLEGHESSVLRVEFLTNGLQIVSAGGDGLLKLFAVKSSECLGTFERHEGRVWALAVRHDESELVSGGADSLLVRWRDVTEAKKLEKLQQNQELALQEQQLSNYMHNEQLLDALKLALRLNRPMHVLRIVQNLIKKQESHLADTISRLQPEQKELLLTCATAWNMNSKNSHAAQLVLNILLNDVQMGDFKPVGLSGAVESALPYTERHFRRLTQLLQDLQFVKYTIDCMQPHAKVS